MIGTLVAMSAWKLVALCSAILVAGVLARLPVEAVIGLGRHVPCGPAIRAALGHAPELHEPDAGSWFIDSPQEQANRACAAAGRDRLLEGVAVVAIAGVGVWVSGREKTD